MANIENLFKYQMPIGKDRHWPADDLGTHFFVSSCYKTILIKNPTQTGVDAIDDIYHKVNPFLRYLASKHLSEKYEGYLFTESTIKIGIMIKDGIDELDFKDLLHIEFDYHEERIHFEELVYVEFDPYTTYSKPFEIHIEIITEYRTLGEYVSEVEVESEEEDKPTIIKSYREKHCVVCLSNKPEVLYYDCKHYCVFHECEARNPFKRCPCCRTRIKNEVCLSGRYTRKQKNYQ